MPLAKVGERGYSDGKRNRFVKEQPLRAFLFIFAATLVARSSEAMACMSPEPLDYGMYFQSEVFIRAEIESYEVQRDGSGAIVRFRTTKTFRGPRLEHWNAKWRGRQGHVPADWQDSGEVFVAIQAEISRDGVAFIAVNQPLCMLNTIIPATVENARFIGLRK